MGREEEEETEKRRVRDRGKALCMHCCTVAPPLAGFGRQQSNEARPGEVTTDPLSLFTAPAHGVGRKKSFPGIKEILAA